MSARVGPNATRGNVNDLVSVWWLNRADSDDERRRLLVQIGEVAWPMEEVTARTVHNKLGRALGSEPADTPSRGKLLRQADEVRAASAAFVDESDKLVTAVRNFGPDTKPAYQASDAAREARIRLSAAVFNLCELIGRLP